MPSARHAPTVERSLDPVMDFMRLLWSIEHGLQRMSKRMENALGITGPQRLVLRVVGRFPDISARELAYLVRLHPSIHRHPPASGGARLPRAAPRSGGHAPRASAIEPPRPRAHADA